MHVEKGLNLLNVFYYHAKVLLKFKGYTFLPIFSNQRLSVWKDTWFSVPYPFDQFNDLLCHKFK